MVRSINIKCRTVTGIQMGTAVWEQYCAEHNIDITGKKKTDDLSFMCFYEETGAGQYMPRNLCVDLEPNCIDDVKNQNIQKSFIKFLLLLKKMQLIIFTWSLCRW